MKAKSATPSVLLSNDGMVIAEFKRINRQWVPLEKIAPSVIDALIATEDRRFYDHHGIDFRRTVGAFLNTLRGDLQGGSTITQQLARNLYPDEIGRAATLTRKVKEAITAVKIEAVYTKREILETYLNTVPFLYNAFGIEMAARTYFDKSAGELNALEAATLIGMLKATSTFNPVKYPDRARERRNLVLAQMAKEGKLTEAQLAALTKRPLKLDFERQTEPPSPAPHIVQYLRKWLIDWADQRDYDIYSDGLVVRTTIDSRLQKAANQAVTRQMKQLEPLANAVRKRDQESSVLQAGFMAMDPRNGYVRAWVGSRDFAEEQFDHVADASRAPRSSRSCMALRS
jgi:penicillin-binding protein 1A